MLAKRSSQRPISIVCYDQQWAQDFEELSEVLRDALGGLVARVEHVGSTSVPGLAAKPVLDIDLVIAKSTPMPHVIAALSALGYEHRGDQGIPGREAFGRADDLVPRDGSERRWPRHHLYVCRADADELARHLAFRDYLRAHPEAVGAYAHLKRRLAERHPTDRDAYCRAKTDFICEILANVVPHLVDEARRSNAEHGA